MAYNGYFPAPKVERAPFGLLDVATVIEHGEDDERWANGTPFSFQSPLAGYKVETFEPCGDTTTGKHKSFDSVSSEQYPESQAFAVRVTHTCSTPLGLREEDYEKVLDELELSTGHAVEREFWKGDHAKTLSAPAERLYLANNSATLIGSGSGQSVAQSLSLLESAYADISSGDSPFIHMPRGVAARLSEYLILSEDGKYYTTVGGSRVVIGSGYTGLNDSAQGTYIYATRGVTVHLSEGEIVGEYKEAVSPTTNSVQVVAERFAAVVVDPTRHLAARVDLATL